MEKLKRPLQKIDKFQQRHHFSAFTVAVFKKYGDDHGGRLAGLMTYYSFVSIFPLLLAAMSAAHIFLRGHPDLKAKVSDTIGSYFPVIGNELQSSIHSIHRTGLALILGLLITLYGARGGADAIRYALNKIWRVPEDKQPGFPASIANSLLIILAGGGGLVLASVLSSYAAGLAHGADFRLVSIFISLAVLTFAFYQVFRLGITSRVPTRKDLFISALSAAIGVQILQLAGGYLLTHELKRLTSLYGTFAVVLGMLFWLYLQVQVFLLAAVAGAVHSKRLWPRQLF